ncbi:hypothetical protein A4G28_04430 [Mycobacterium ostraviense]|uniref:Uncharacterized protein n=1 Tax=Mycobacterium ostraviense TaxID=2738409 RepID=A0A164B3P7_9MYCO|nr:hypothetical protein A4G28_04430 [Mycobacterium ostraviense]
MGELVTEVGDWDGVVFQNNAPVCVDSGEFGPDAAVVGFASESAVGVIHHEHVSLDFIVELFGLIEA